MADGAATRVTFTRAELAGLVRMADWALDEGEDDKPTLHGIVKLRNALGRLNFAARHPVSIIQVRDR